MTNKKGKKRNNDKKQKKIDNLPFVSVCTPTYNRRPFIKYAIKNFLKQDYPLEKMEWIIIDDGTDKIEDLVKDVPNVKYFKYDTKMSLGKKRNLMHEKSKGDILVYMDDDDYYPPCRVSHAVKTLQSHPEALCSGSSEIYIYFKHIQKLYQFGPYGKNHATAGTFAFKRKLLETSSYEDEAALAEEKAFLKNYSVPFVQLDPLKTILVFSHEHNTFDKRKLLNNPHPQLVKESDKNVDMFVREKDAKKFYMEEIEGLLENYEPGRPEMKPDVLIQMARLEKERNQKMEEMMKQQNQNDNNVKIMTKDNNGNDREVSKQELVGIITNQKEQLNKLNTIVKEMDELLETKDNTINKLRELNNSLLQKIKNYQTNQTENNINNDINDINIEKLQEQNFDSYQIISELF